MNHFVDILKRTLYGQNWSQNQGATFYFYSRSLKTKISPFVVLPWADPSIVCNYESDCLRQLAASNVNEVIPFIKMYHVTGSQIKEVPSWFEIGK